MRGDAWTRRRASGAIAAALSALPAAARARAPGGPPAVDAPGTLGLALGFDALRWRTDAELAGDLDDMAALGARWLRTDLDWRAIEPDGPGAREWSAFDRVVDLAGERGVAVLPVPGKTPDWAGADPNSPSPPAGTAAFAGFVAEAVARYRPRGVRAWEVWNEPNLARFWPPAPDPEAYAALLAAASAAIRANDPGATVILGGLAAVHATGPVWGVRHHAADEFLDAVYARAGAEAFDAVGFHPYSHPAPPSPTARRNGWALMAGPVRAVMRRRGDAAKPIWITEYGAPTAPGPRGVTPAEQAAFLEAAHRLASAAPWAGPLMWYSLDDLGDDPDEPEHWFGLRAADGAAKPAHARFTALAAEGR